MFAISLLLWTLSCFGQSNDTTALPDPDKVYEIADVAPEYEGGTPAFMKLMLQNIGYPQEARVKGITGKVFVEFVVERDGKILRENMKIVRSVHPLLDDEAIRVILLSSPWKPGVINGQPVRAKRTFPISFNLEGVNVPKRRH